jgi:protein O-mannosyl-transferase
MMRVDPPNTTLYGIAHKANTADRLPIVAWVLAAVVLISLTLAVYLQVADYQFVHFDDDVYVAANRHMAGGLTWGNVKWAFTRHYAGNWHPLTWLSHMLDVSVFGPWAGGHHLTSLLFHLLNTILLLGFLAITTGRLLPAFVVAALFALHPLHVESVAWISERKDVLSTFFLMLALVAYVRYARVPGLLRYLLVVLFFCMGLMSKPMVVTLPLVLLLVDYWPLRRFTLEGWRIRADGSTPGRLLLEKGPLLILSAAMCVVTAVAQRKAMPLREMLDIPSRLTNAIISYVRYICEMLWPVDLCALYLHPGVPQYGQAAASIVVVVGMTVVAIWLGRRHRYLLVGWLWYLLTLVPVLGLVQVGIQSHADRYTYIPLIGIFIAVAWAADEYVSRRPRAGWLIAGAASAAIGSLALVAWSTVGYWKDDATLFSRALSVTPDNYRMMTNMGIYLVNAGEVDQAESLLERSNSLRPGEVSTLNGLGTVTSRQGRYDDAARYFQAAIEAAPEKEEPVVNLGLTRLAQGRYDEAAECFRKALVMVPDWALAYDYLGQALGSGGRLDEAIIAMKRAVELDPYLADAHFNLGNLYAAKQDLAAAVTEYEGIIGQTRDYRVFDNLGICLMAMGRPQEAEKVYRSALSQGLGGAAPHAALAGVLEGRGRREEAVAELRLAMQLDPGNPAFRQAYMSLMGGTR